MRTGWTMHFVAGIQAIAVAIIGAVSLLLCLGFVFVLRDHGLAIKNVLTSQVSLQKNSALVLVSSPLPSGASQSLSESFSFLRNTVLPYPSTSVITDANKLSASNSPAGISAIQRIIIAEVCPGITSADEEYVELFNPNTNTVDLTNWQLRKKTESGTDSALVSKAKFAGSIKPSSYFLISDPDYQNTFKADLTWSSAGYSIAGKNTVTLLDSEGRIMDEIAIPAGLDSACISRTDPKENTFVISSSVPYTSKYSGGFEKPVQYASVSPTPSPFPTPLPSISPSPTVAASVVLITPTPDSTPLNSSGQATPTPIIESSPTPSIEPDSTSSPQASPEPSPEPTPSPLPTPVPKLLITEVQIGGESADQEYVKLHNLSNAAVDLTGWQLRKKNKGGTDSVLVSQDKFSGTVQSNSYFVISHPDYQSVIGADLVWSSLSYSLTASSTVYLLDNNEIMKDLVGWGGASSCEGSCYPVSPKANEILQRKNLQDTDNNQNDFEIMAGE